MQHSPGYIQLYNSGELEKRIQYFENIYKSCTLCPHKCEINRFKTSSGFCKSSDKAIVASFNAHFGEEEPLVGNHGSGTIFFSACNLRCIYCQNYEISQLREGIIVSEEQLANMMLSLQERRCHNVNFVSPTHVVLPILKALKLAIIKGFKLPLVYNTGGYDSTDSLEKLKGIFDIYMPDIKYYEKESAIELSEAKNYPEISQLAIKEMHRQVGDLKLDKENIAYKGLIIRHLVLPNYHTESKKIIDFIATISKKSFFNIMPQYRPQYKAYKCSKINTSLSIKEFKEVIDYAQKAGLKLTNYE